MLAFLKRLFNMPRSGDPMDDALEELARDRRREENAERASADIAEDIPGYPQYPRGHRSQTIVATVPTVAAPAPSCGGGCAC